VKHDNNNNANLSGDARGVKAERESPWKARTATAKGLVTNRFSEAGVAQLQSGW